MKGRFLTLCFFGSGSLYFLTDGNVASWLYQVFSSCTTKCFNHWVLGIQSHKRPKIHLVQIFTIELRKILLCCHHLLKKLLLIRHCTKHNVVIRWCWNHAICSRSDSLQKLVHSILKVYLSVSIRRLKANLVDFIWFLLFATASLWGALFHFIEK